MKDGDPNGGGHVAEVDADSQPGEDENSEWGEANDGEKSGNTHSRTFLGLTELVFNFLQGLVEDLLALGNDGSSYRGDRQFNIGLQPGLKM